MFAYDIGKRLILDLLVDQQVLALIQRMFGKGGPSEVDRAKMDADRMRAESERRGIQERITGIDVAVADVQMQLAAGRAQFEANGKILVAPAEETASLQPQIMLWVRGALG